MHILFIYHGQIYYFQDMRLWKHEDRSDAEGRSPQVNRDLDIREGKKEGNGNDPQEEKEGNCDGR